MTARKKVEAAPEPEVEAPVKDSDTELSENTRSPQRKARGDRLAQIEALIDEEIAENPDNGDGSHVHRLSIKRTAAGLRDAQRAWQHQTESPLSSGAQRDADLAEAVAG